MKKKSGKTPRRALIFLSFVGIFLIGISQILGSRNPEPEPGLTISEYLIIHSNSLSANSNPASGEFSGKKLIRTVNAYYPVVWQTDETPCISASGMDICQTDKKICASNEFALGTRLLIEEEICEVQDRMNAKYQKTIDRFFKTKGEASVWGSRRIEVIKLD